MLERLEPAKDGKHKWIAYFKDGTTTRFGAKGMDDYTLTGDEKARASYRARHAKDLRTNDPKRAGYLSYYILWNKPTIEASIRDFNKRFF